MLGGGEYLKLRRNAYLKSHFQCVCAFIGSLLVVVGGGGGFINRAAAVIELFVLSILNLKLL